MLSNIGFLPSTVSFSFLAKTSPLKIVKRQAILETLIEKWKGGKKV
jgi:hypothetical protein